MDPATQPHVWIGDLDGDPTNGRSEHYIYMALV